MGDISIPSGIVNRGQVEDPKHLVGVLKEFKEKLRQSLLIVITRRESLLV